MSRRPRALAVSVVLLLAAGACDHKKTTPAPPAATSASAAPAATVTATPPWYPGHWSGVYLAKKQDMGKMVGPEIGWQKDEGGTASGVGHLSLDITGSGHITGKASGPLGDMTARGTVDGELLRIRLVPVKRQVSSFTGFVIARRNDNTQTAHGSLHASSGDSLLVRDAKVKLDKGDSTRK